MPVIPKSGTNGFPGFVYLAWHTKQAGEKVVRTLGQARQDTGQHLGNSFAYLAQCRCAEQVGPKKTDLSGYRLCDMRGLDEYLPELGAKDVSRILRVPLADVLSWHKTAPVSSPAKAASPSLPPGQTKRNPGQPAEQPAAVRAGKVSERPALPAPNATSVAAENLETTFRNALQPLSQRLADLEAGQLQLGRQLERLGATLIDVRPAPRSPSPGTAPSKLEDALVSMIGLLRELPDRLVSEQTEKVVEMLQAEGKHTGRAIRGMRETLEFQNREILAVQSKVADSLTRLLSTKDSTLQALADSLQSALSMVPELPDEHPLNSPAAAHSSAGLAAAQPGNGTNS